MRVPIRHVGLVARLSLNSGIAKRGAPLLLSSTVKSDRGSLSIFKCLQCRLTDADS
ncbi:hypothetical protein PSAB6_150050 [Paraburkholderia sabiae]|nr:hypothetical protein PSAB6_150050 [Paraburkholderia sabiae]